MVSDERWTARAWVGGGLAWAAAAALGWAAADGSTRFFGAQAVWCLAQLLLVVGIVRLRGLRPGGARRTVALGFGLAIVGRLAFLGVEVVSLTTGELAEELYPLGALPTAAGMVLAGVGVVRADRWCGWRSWTLLVMGLYPLATIFPMAATGGSPDLAVALWSVPTIAIGLAVASEARRKNLDAQDAEQVAATARS